MSQGRKPISKDGELMKPRAIRMLDSEWEKCLALGGSVWIRKRIQRAKVVASRKVK
jgi:hypothetical protein